MGGALLSTWKHLNGIGVRDTISQDILPILGSETLRLHPRDLLRRQPLLVIFNGVCRQLREDTSG